jgi:anti-anti-sigma factor
MLKIDVQSAPPSVTLVCSGRIVFGTERETLRSIAISRPERDLRLDTSRVSAIDAAGLGLLVELQHWARKRRASLRIIKPSSRAQKLLALAGLHRVLDVSGAHLAADAELEPLRAMTA